MLMCMKNSVHVNVHASHFTGRSLILRMNDHRSAIKKGGQSLLDRHFQQPNHSVDDMRVQILEKFTTALEVLH